MSGNAFLVRVRFALAVALTACTAAAAAQTAAAADWPKGPVHVVVPYGPGSTPDIIARIVGDRLAKRSGQPVIVENKAGAAGAVCAAAPAATAAAVIASAARAQTRDALRNIFSALSSRSWRVRILAAFPTHLRSA